MGSAAGGAGGAAAPPDFGGKFFNTFRPPQILAGFVVKCFNSIIKILELREWESILGKITNFL